MDKRVAKSDRSRTCTQTHSLEVPIKPVTKFQDTMISFKGLREDLEWNVTQDVDNTDDHLLEKIVMEDQRLRKGSAATDDDTLNSQVFEEGVSMSNIRIYTQDEATQLNDTALEQEMRILVDSTVKTYGVEHNISGEELFAILKDKALFTKFEKSLLGEIELTCANSILDLGDRPIFKGEEDSSLRYLLDNRKPKDPSIELSDHLYLPPRQHANLMVATYSECQPVFVMRTDHMEVYSDKLLEHTVTKDDLQHTMNTINEVMKPNRGTLAFYDRIILFYLLFGLAFTAFLCILVGMFLHYSLSVLLGFIYFGALGVFIWYIKKRTKRLVRDSHFCLALVLRAENNRFYLHKGITLRPGFLGKWVEFHFKI